MDKTVHSMFLLRVMSGLLRQHPEASSLQYPVVFEALSIVNLLAIPLTPQWTTCKFKVNSIPTQFHQNTNQSGILLPNFLDGFIHLIINHGNFQFVHLELLRIDFDGLGESLDSFPRGVNCFVAFKLSISCYENFTGFHCNLFLDSDENGLKILMVEI